MEHAGEWKVARQLSFQMSKKHPLSMIYSAWGARNATSSQFEQFMKLLNENPINWVKQNLENFLDLILIIQYVNLQGKDDYLGRCMLFPKVRLKGIEAPEPKLLWHKVKRGGQDGGEILAECELFLVRRSKLKRSVFRLFVYVHRWICKTHWKEKKRRFLSSHRACVVPRTSIVVF